MGNQINTWFVVSFPVIWKVYIDLWASCTEQGHPTSLRNYTWPVTKFEPLVQLQILPLPGHLEKFTILIGYGMWKCRVCQPTNLLKVLIGQSLAFKVGEPKVIQAAEGENRLDIYVTCWEHPQIQILQGALCSSWTSAWHGQKMKSLS